MSLNTQRGCKSQRGKLADMPLKALQIPTAIHISVNVGKPSEFWLFCSFKVSCTKIQCCESSWCYESLRCLKVLLRPAKPGLLLLSFWQALQRLEQCHRSLLWSVTLLYNILNYILKCRPSFWAFGTLGLCPNHPKPSCRMLYDICSLAHKTRQATQQLRPVGMEATKKRNGRNWVLVANLKSVESVMGAGAGERGWKDVFSHCTSGVWNSPSTTLSTFSYVLPVGLTGL